MSIVAIPTLRVPAISEPFVGCSPLLDRGEEAEAVQNRSAEDFLLDALAAARRAPLVGLTDNTAISLAFYTRTRVPDRRVR